MILAEYWVLKGTYGFLVRTVQGTKARYLMINSWKEAEKFASLNSAQQLCAKMAKGSDEDPAFWWDLKPCKITIKID